MIGIGIDTGGTCTDAILYDFDARKICGYGKALTTKDHLETGIAAALDTLPPQLLKKAEMIALSTTLATNACVENKGTRSKLLMIGFDESLMDHLKDIYASYGLKDRTQFIILDAKVEGLYSQPFDPDWDDLRRRAKEYFEDCDSIGIVQKHPRANGGRFELTAQQILKEEVSLPITISYDISNEVDVLKTAAGTMLNARLVPLISEFMDAVHHVLDERGLHIPVSIIRSDGTMMPEEMAKIYPVETILCGPSASVVGGSALAGEEDGLIVDMGGTTTDIAVIRKKKPVLAGGGIRIGQWKTMVQGLYVNTFGLGGDSAVRYKDEKLFLDTVRVIPLSVLASQYQNVLPALRKLAENPRISAVWTYEFYVLQKDIAGKKGYSEYEHRLCDALKEGPLLAMELAERMGRYPGMLAAERLEEDGILIKSGLTPTDMMILKGDFDLYGKEAAELAIRCLCANIHPQPEEIPDLVYDLVYRRLYHCIGKVLLKQQYPDHKELSDSEYLEMLLDCFYEQAKEREKTGEKALQSASLSLTTQYPLIGVGAPIHVFLPKAAGLLGTRAVIPELAGVANALGAAVCRKAAQCMLTIKAEYDSVECIGYSFAHDGKRYFFEDQEKALSAGKEAVMQDARKRALLLGMKGTTKIDLQTEENRFGHTKEGLLFEILLTASAMDDQPE